jgi:hypothetical protein
LLALSAPRPLFIAVAEQDLGSDPRGRFLSAVAAAPVYRFLGADGFGATGMPPLHRRVMSTIGFHIRAGRHDVTSYDWDQYMNFADRHMTGSPLVAGDIGWVVDMFNSRNLDGWQADSHPEAWSAQDGVIVETVPDATFSGCGASSPISTSRRRTSSMAAIRECSFAGLRPAWR